MERKVHHCWSQMREVQSILNLWVQSTRRCLLQVSSHSNSMAKRHRINPEQATGRNLNSTRGICLQSRDIHASPWERASQKCAVYAYIPGVSCSTVLRDFGCHDDCSCSEGKVEFREHMSINYCWSSRRNCNPITLWTRKVRDIIPCQCVCVRARARVKPSSLRLEAMKLHVQNV